MSLESVFANPPPLVGADNDTAKEDKESYSQSDTLPLHDASYGRSSSWASYGQSTQGPEDDLEDGELEDGEIDDPEGEAPAPAPTPPVTAEVPVPKHSPAKHHGYQGDNIQRHHERSPKKSHSDEESEDEDRSRKRKKKKRRKDHKRREETKHDKDKKKKKKKYVDHDRVQEEYPTGYSEPSMSWSTYGRSPPGPYDSPQYPEGNSDRGIPSQPYGGEMEQGFPEDGESPKGKGFNRGGGGGGGGGYSSPPGLYDSPSDEDDYGPPQKLKRSGSHGSPMFSRFDSMESGGGRGGGGGHGFNKHHRGGGHSSMLSMVGEDMMDPNVAANENEEMFDRGPHGPPMNKKPKKDKSMYMFRQQDDREGKPKKRTLAATPMNERPICHFHMEGKCHKGNNCQFNHDFERRKKFDLCKYYLNGYCHKGNDCSYMHGDYPCKYYHLDGHCPKGNECRFSHAELTPDTMNMFTEQQMLKETGNFRSSQEDHHKPRIMHNRDPNTKIPSIFDIEVFPPGKGPRNNGPPNNQGMQGPPPGMQGPPPGMQGPPPGMQGPPPGMQGPPPGMQGPPPGMPTNNQQGPPMGMQSPNRPPRPPFFNDMSGPPPGQQSLLGPPPRAMFAGNMGPPGMRGPMPGGPMGPPGPMGPRGMGPRGPGFFNNGMYNGPDGPFDQNSSGEDFPNGPRDQDDREPRPIDNASMEAEALGAALANLDPNTDNIPAHLPAKQRELFMRIKQQQRDNVVDPSAADQDERGPVENWYSSDEDESSPHKTNKKGEDVSKLWNSIQNSSGPGGGQNFDIAQMITAIRTMSGQPNNNQGGGNNNSNNSGNTNTPRDPRQGPKTDPRLARLSDPRTANRPGSTTPTQAQSPARNDENVEIDGSIAHQTKQGKRVLYILHPCDANLSANVVPKGVSVDDENFKEDPRVLKAFNKLEPRKPRSETELKTRGAMVKGGQTIQSPPGRSGQEDRAALAKTTSLSPQGGDPRLTDARMIQRTMSAPTGVPADLLAPPKLLSPPDMPDALKQRPTGSSRRLSTDQSSGGEQSPRAKDGNKVLSYRNDPRFRKKKLPSGSSEPGGESNSASGMKGNPSSDEEKDSSKEMEHEHEPQVYNPSAASRGMEHASPLSLDSAEGEESSGFGFYNRPPNDNFTQFQEHQKKSRKENNSRGSQSANNRTTVNDDSSKNERNNSSPNSSQTDKQDKILNPLDEPSLRDVFKTIDPTASPFCQQDF